jgi:hypothetical protein
LTADQQIAPPEQLESDVPNPSNSRLAEAAGEAAFVISIGAAVAFTILYVLRSGSGDSAKVVAGLMVLGVLPLLVGAAVLSRVFVSAERRNITMAAATIASLLAPCVAIYSRPAAFLLVSGLGLWAVGTLLRKAKSFRRVGARPTFFGASVVGGLLVVSTDPSRVFAPEQMTLGIGGGDALFHAAIAQMIARYGSVALGADGLAYVHYYFLSHMVAAGLSKLTSANVPLVYTYWGAISLKLQLLWGIVLAALLLEDEDRGSATMAMIAFAWLVAVLTHALESESFLLGLVIFLTLLPTLCGLAGQPNKAPTFVALFALIGAFVCAATKASIGFFVAVALLGAAWRLRRFLRLSLGLIGSLCLLAIVTLRYLSPVNTLLLDAGWRVLLASYLQYIDGVAVISFFLPLLLLLIAARQPRVFSSRSVKMIEWRVEMDAGSRTLPDGFFRRWLSWMLNASSGPIFILGLSLAACTVVLFTVPIGSNVAYFSLVLLVMAAAMAPSVLRPLSLGIKKQGIQRLLVGSMTVVFGVMAIQFAWGTKNTVAELYRTAFSAPLNQSVGALVLTSVENHHSLLGAIREQSALTPWSLLTRDILAHAADGSELSVHTPPAVDEFWTRLYPSSALWCINLHLMIPAELGIVQIRNIAPRSIETRCVSDGFAFYGFGKTPDLHRTAVLTDEQLCAAARQSKIVRVYIVNSVADLSRNVVLNCP